MKLLFFAALTTVFMLNANASVQGIASSTMTVTLSGLEAGQAISALQALTNSKASTISVQSVDCHEGFDLGETNCQANLGNFQMASLGDAEAKNLFAILNQAKQIVFSNPANNLHPAMGDMIGVTKFICDSSQGPKCEIEFSPGGGTL